MKNFFFLFWLSLFLFACKDPKPSEGGVRPEYSVSGNLTKNQIDSIRKSEESKPLTLKRIIYEADSATAFDVMIPITHSYRENSFSFPLILHNPDKEIPEVDNDSYAISIQDPFSSSYNEILMFLKSDNPNLLPVNEIKKLNEIQDIIYEDANSLLFSDHFEGKILYHHIYDATKSLHYLYYAKIPKESTEKEQYSLLFNSLERAKNILAFEKAIPATDLTWEKIKPTLPTALLKNYQMYYNSMAKDMKYFLQNDDSVHINEDRFEWFLYRDDDHSKNKFNQIPAIANSKFSGTFGELDFKNLLYPLYFGRKFGEDEEFRFVKQISDNSILVRIAREGSSEPSFFILSSIQIPSGQYYLISPTDEDGSTPVALMNDYFSTHLKI